MHPTDRILENIRKEVELHGRSGPDCVYKTDIQFCIPAGQFSTPSDCDPEAAWVDFKWFLRCEDCRMSIAHPDPDKSFWLKRYGDDALPYGITWDLHLLCDILKEPTKWRRAVLFNPQHLRIPACILSYQFQEVDYGQIDVTVTLRSSDLANALSQDVMMTRLLLEYVCNKVDATPGKMTFNLTNAHVYYSDMDAPEEFTIDFGD